MHPEHAAMLAEVKALADPRRAAMDTMENDSYGGSGHPYYFVSVPDRRRIAQTWVRAHRAWPPADVLTVVESLFSGASHEEKTLASLVIAYSVPARKAATPAQVEAWLGSVNGWAEVDGLCQNVFKVEDMLADWNAWRGLIERLRVSADINRRRASLVLLTGPVRYAKDAHFADLAFATVEVLKSEREILITKAVSWLLRSLTHRHGPRVAGYVEDEAASLPAVAVRETRVKLATGTKSGKRR